MYKRQVLDEVLKGTNLRYEEQGKVIVIKRGLQKPEPDSVKNVMIEGMVVDKQGEVLPGVTVVLKGTSVGVATGNDGTFKLNIPRRDSVVLIFSFVGMKTKEVNWKGQRVLKIILEEDVRTMEEVVVTGYQVLKKSDMAGSSSVVRAKDLLLSLIHIFRGVEIGRGFPYFV